MSESNFLTTLNLSPDDRLRPPKTIGRLKTIQEWASTAIDSVKDNKDFLTSLSELSPWAEAAFSAAKDSIGPIKFAVKLFDELTKIQDPEELANLACTLAYQGVAEKAIGNAGPPAHAAIDGARLNDLVDDVDFSDFDLQRMVTHPFVMRADRVLRHYLPQGGYSAEQVSKIISNIHADLVPQLSSLISDGKSKEKFDPLYRWIQLPNEGRLSRAALRRHADYVAWLFNDAPVLQCEPYALGHVCIAADCSKLTHRDLREIPGRDRQRPNPFREGKENGGRHPLLETVMEYIADPKFRDAIVIQGSAGCGKSTFTLRLAAHLREEGLRPIRIRLRDVVLGKEFYSQLGEALSYQDDIFLRVHDRFSSITDTLQNGAIFREEVLYGKNGAPICPYVLILDGWDEISVAVSEGFKQRVKELLLRIRSELLRAGRPNVRVILTGRPSDAIDDCTEFFRDETPILTVRTLHPKQLPEYAGMLREATETKPLAYDGVSNWKFPKDEDVQPIFKAYSNEFNSEQNSGNHVGNPTTQTGVAAVLGYPLLLHFTFRLLAETDVDRRELIESPTALLRRLTDYATEGADKPSDRQDGAKIQSRVSGSDLRCLLRRTAAQMTALGQESIAKAELEKRLKTTDLTGHVKELSKDKVISALLVSFYFKGGNTALGCEFTHKAFREYLFAEEIVETLKTFARTISHDLPERPSSLYWRDFDDADPRKKMSFDFAALVAPQWLSPEVVRYLGSLLEWEIARSFSRRVEVGSAGVTSPCSSDEWQRARTLSADLWDWWAEGVHLRPQPHEDENTGQIKWDESVAEKLVPRCRPLLTNAGDLPEPVRTTTLDAHIGDALFRICAWIHWYLQKHETLKMVAPERRYQSQNNDKLTFRPTGSNVSYFRFFCSRISAAGWRPEEAFPKAVFCKGIDFTGTHLSNIDFSSADLQHSSFMGARVIDCNFHKVDLTGCDFSNGHFQTCSFPVARLDNVNFTRCTLFANRFNGSSFSGATILESQWLEAAWESGSGMVPVPLNDFSDVQGLDDATIKTLQSRKKPVLHSLP